MKQIIIAFFFICFLSSCKKDKKSDEPVIPVVTTGNITGIVSQYDQFGTRYTSGLNTTTVSLEGRPNTTVTDQNGKYTFPEMATGTYTLVFRKPGCGLVKIQDIAYKFTDTITYNAKIADIPLFSISSAIVKDTLWFSGTVDGIYYHATTSPADSRATLVAIIGKSPNITITNAQSYLNDAPVSLIGATDYKRFLSYSFLSQSYHFKKDSIVYIKIFPVAAIGPGYLDNTINKTVYTAYGNAYPTFTIVMPQ